MHNPTLGIISLFSCYKLNLTVFVILNSRLICCSFGSDGFSFQEVREGISSRCGLSHFPCDDRGIPTWHHAQSALKFI